MTTRMVTPDHSRDHIHRKTAKEKNLGLDFVVAKNKTLSFDLISL